MVLSFQKAFVKGMISHAGWYIREVGRVNLMYCDTIATNESDDKASSALPHGAVG